MTDPSARALQHVLVGQREVANVPDIPPETPVCAIERVGIVGTGLMGSGIALACLNAGLPVIMIDQAEEARTRALATIGKALDRDVAKGRVTADQARQRLAGLSIHSDLGALASADLVVEAVYENLEVKRSVFADLERVAAPRAILATNSSTLDIDAIGSVLRDPSRFVGLHFFSPANVMKLLEIVRGDRTGATTLATAMRFAKTIGKVGVVARSCDGFIGNRMFEEYLRQAYFLLEEGASPARIDGALEAWGMAMGPLKVMDLAGQDIGWAIRKRRMIEQPDRPYSRIPDLICEQGRFGQKTGAGFYLYPEGRTAMPDPRIDALIQDHAAGSGIARREIDDAEIVDRCVLALANEGAKILAEGIAARPVDIDMVWVFGYGFPQTRGGPMYHAREQGAGSIRERITRFSRGSHGWAWNPEYWPEPAAL